MLVLSMNSKRQRRPNVRLGEVGDIPAAFACGFSQKTEENFGHKRYKSDLLSPNEIQTSSICGLDEQIHSAFVVSDPGVAQRISADILQNRENKNPNSSKSAFDLASLDEIDMAKSELNFGTITRKCRVMKRRSRNTKGNNDVFGPVWSSKLHSQFSNEDGKECGVKEFVGFSSEGCNDYYAGTGYKEILDNETLSKEAGQLGMDDSIYDMIQQQNFNDFAQEDAYYEGNEYDASPASGHVWDEMKFGSGNVHTVTTWLEEQGFGKYAGMFEMHEVDEEALPLLTLEDLKEMGVFAVGSRRKLYNAIQQLSKDVSA